MTSVVHLLVEARVGQRRLSTTREVKKQTDVSISSKRMNSQEISIRMPTLGFAFAQLKVPWLARSGGCALLRWWDEQIYRAHPT